MARISQNKLDNEQLKTRILSSVASLLEKLDAWVGDGSEQNLGVIVAPPTPTSIAQPEPAPAPIAQPAPAPEPAPIAQPGPAPVAQAPTPAPVVQVAPAPLAPTPAPSSAAPSPAPAAPAPAAPAMDLRMMCQKYVNEPGLSEADRLARGNHLMGIFKQFGVQGPQQIPPDQVQAFIAAAWPKA